jgi:RNA polymerase sigma-70 factor, ECF subfamily
MVREKEAALIEQARAGSKIAFAELIQPYAKRIYALAYQKLKHQQEAEDVTQETWLRAFVHLRRFNRDRPLWLYRIAINLCIDRIRKRKADFYLDSPCGKEGEGDWYHRIPGDDLTPEETLLSQELHGEIHQALSQLPHNYRTVMMLRYMNQLPLAEIGRILHLPVTTVKTRVHRGRKALRNRLASSL